jgi:indolepyruvate ferredoxin oxidoreductase alpha subunit
MKELMLGNAAIARGLYEAGCRVVSSYPGTPSTEITEAAARFEEIYCEWAPNEKVAAEVALGASIGGARAFCAMKHVGLNVAADPVFTASYTGVGAGLVLAVADDPGMHSSQNEQDSRHYAIAAKLPMLEPSDSTECLAFTKLAFSISERFSTPVMIRLSTRVSHSQSLVEVGPRQADGQYTYRKDAARFVMVPANARARHPMVEQRQRDIALWAETCGINSVEKGESRIGVITSGICYQYVKEALPKASVLKLGIVNPLPVGLIREFAADMDTLYVVEELDPILENACKAMGLAVTGKVMLPLCGEYSQSLLRETLLGEKPEPMSFGENVPVRPPVMCPGCPHRGLFYVLSKLKVMVNGDIGCYTLGSAPPLSAMDATVCMGFSVSGLHGFNLAGRRQGSEKKSVAVIGDSTFMHSGITGLVNVVYNGTDSVVIVLDNSTTGMTGHQDNPTTGKTLKGDIARAVSIEALCRGIGIERVSVADPNDLAGMEKLIKAELEAEGPSVIVARRPCALLKTVVHAPAMRVTGDCRGCRACMKIGCPAISMRDKKAAIDPTLCVGCGVCAQLCAFGAILSDGEVRA